MQEWGGSGETQQRKAVFDFMHIDTSDKMKIPEPLQYVLSVDEDD